MLTPNEMVPHQGVGCSSGTAQWLHCGLDCRRSKATFPELSKDATDIMIGKSVDTFPSRFPKTVNTRSVKHFEPVHSETQPRKHMPCKKRFAFYVACAIVRYSTATCRAF